jgi:SPP1 family predicted phage head-tail adaptor
MRGGKYLEEAIIERETASGALDAYGNPVDQEWVEFSKPRANFRETTGKENIAAGRLEGKATGTLRMRSFAKLLMVTSADRVQIRGHFWVIVGAPIHTDAGQQEIEFTLERGGAVG